MAVFLGSFYIFLGIIFLIVPLIYLELGRPKDLIKGGLNLIIGVILLLKERIFSPLDYLILILTSILIIFFALEICSMRWNQLTDNERNKLKTLVEFKKNISIICEATLLLKRNFSNILNLKRFGQTNKNLIKKKWVRDVENGKIDNSTENNLVKLEMPKEMTAQFKDDVLEEKNN